MNFLKLLPVIMQILNILPRIQEAIRTKVPILTILQQYAPELIPIFSELAGSLFPKLAEPQAVEAGALLLSPDIVRQVQNGLNKLKVTDDSGSSLAEDGSYGPRTKQAVTKFQTSKGLKPDGWAGPETQAAISSEVVKLPVV